MRLEKNTVYRAGYTSSLTILGAGQTMGIRFMVMVDPSLQPIGKCEITILFKDNTN